MSLSGSTANTLLDCQTCNYPGVCFNLFCWPGLKLGPWNTVLQLTVDELRRLEDDVRRRLDALVAAARLYYLISGVVAAATAVYAALATVTHCVARSRCARCCCCAANRKRKRNEQPELDLDPHTDPGIRTGTCTQTRTRT